MTIPPEAAARTANSSDRIAKPFATTDPGEVGPVDLVVIATKAGQVDSAANAALALLGANTVVLPIENIDTDQIIPARFLKATSKVGMGKHLFADWRFAADGQPRADFVLNRPEAAGAGVLVAGDNFGCG